RFPLRTLGDVGHTTRGCRSAFVRPILFRGAAMEVTSCPGPLVWEKYALGLVEEAEQHALEAHLRGCSRCLERLGRVPAAVTLVADLRSGLTVTNEQPDFVVDQVIRSAVELGATETGASAGDRPRPSAEPLDFLAPSQEAGELGRL